jgi:hypothetical protein
MILSCTALCGDYSRLSCSGPLHFETIKSKHRSLIDKDPNLFSI